MKEVWNWIQVAISALGGFASWYLGGLDGLIYALIAFVVVDYATGVLRAVFEKKLSSRIGTHGIVKKITIFLLVGIAHMADVYFLNNSGAVRAAVICFYISNEGISLLENASAIGLPVPEKLNEILAQLHEKKKEDE